MLSYIKWINTKRRSKTNLNSSAQLLLIIKRNRQKNRITSKTVAMVFSLTRHMMFQGQLSQNVLTLDEYICKSAEQDPNRCSTSTCAIMNLKYHPPRTARQGKPLNTRQSRDSTALEKKNSKCHVIQSMYMARISLIRMTCHRATTAQRN